MRIFFIIPLAIFIAMLAVFAAKITETNQQEPSPLIGKAVTEFNLPSIYEGSDELSNKDLQTGYSLINIFASWCLTCRIEHPLLMDIKAKNILPIYGLNWKDEPAKARKWLNMLGNPYKKIGSDLKGKVVLEFGITGAPETFLISPDGIILFRHVGVLTKDVLENEILLMVK